MAQHKRLERLAYLVGIVAFAIVALRRAWIADDAAITFRVVENLFGGYGLRWNVAERVQAYTHPLWMLLVAAARGLTGEIFLTAIALSLLLGALAAAVILFGVARSLPGGLLAILALTLSPAYIDYSTSGLENPLAHLLLAVFAALYLRRPAAPAAVARLSLVVGLIAINRLDHLALVLPAMLVVAYERLGPPMRVALAGPAGGRARRVLAALAGPETLALAAGLVPLLGWTAFSVVYYGFPVPNTAFAKLNTAIPGGELAAQGLRYLADAALRDPLAASAIVAAAALALARRDWRASALALGVALYLIYIVRIGGDFMSGRFITAPLLVSAALLAWLTPGSRAGYGLAVAAALLGALNPATPLAVDPPRWGSDISVASNGIADERAYYDPISGLATILRDGRPGGEVWESGVAARAEPVSTARAVGFYAMGAGPGVHVLDVYALTDPLLARLPAYTVSGWRIGHFRRVIPDGYRETLASGRNQLRDPALAAYYDQLSLVVRGPLFSRERWAAIWRLNTGALDGLIDRDAYRYPDLARLTLADAAAPVDPIALRGSGALVSLGGARTERRVELDLGAADAYRVLFRRRGDEIYSASLPPIGDRARPSVARLVELPSAVARAGYDELLIIPVTIDDARLAGVRLLPEAAATPGQ